MTTKLFGIICAAAIAMPAGGAFAVEKLAPKVVSCTQIKTATQLQAMKNNLKGTYCLANDIDAGSIANFIPIGDAPNNYFAGQFYGNGHVIRNLKINNATSPYGGMFGLVGDGIIQDVGLVNAKVTSSFNGTTITGGLIGVATGIGGPVFITRVYATGQMTCTGPNCVAGGVVGALGSNGTVTETWSSAGVTGNGQAGGVFGYLSSGPSTVDQTFATGRVTCTGAFCVAGGLAASANDKVILTRSFATGPVTGGADATLGGLLGLNSTGSYVQRTYATGPVTGGAAAIVGSLIGWQTDGTIKESYGAGAVVGGAGATLGGLVGKATGAPSIASSYWDTLTTGQAASAGGTGKTTTQLRAALLPGFGGAWGINKTLSYPYLNDPDLFTSPLATLALSDVIFSFSPVQQTDKSQYLIAPAHTDAASLATVYTMIARAVGNTDNVALLKDVKIDKYFWKDATQTTTFAGPLATHATLGAMKPIAAATPLNATNVIGQLNLRRVVILRGTYAKAGGGTGTHHMLATLYTKTASNGVNTVVANDPFTGTQVEINPTTKRVTTPFPLKNFTVNGYQAVSNLH